jgi:hypothetical protein
MKRLVISMLGSLAVATTLVAAQNQPKPQTPPNNPSDVTLTGCVTQGSSPTVFLLGNARMNAHDTNEKGKDYVLVAATEDLSFKTHLNHEVTVTGNAEMKAAVIPPAGQKANEKDLPKLTAKSVTEVADTCTMASR